MKNISLLSSCLLLLVTPINALTEIKLQLHHTAESVNQNYQFALPEFINFDRSRIYCPPLESLVITSEYGPRENDFHPGIDLYSYESSDVYAINAGIVIDSSQYEWNGTNGGYGNLLVIQQYDGNYTFYGHLASKSVNVGDYVRAGDVIAQLGSTGNSTGPHLHLEIRSSLNTYGLEVDSYNPHIFKNVIWSSIGLPQPSYCSK